MEKTSHVRFMGTPLRRRRSSLVLLRGYRRIGKPLRRITEIPPAPRARSVLVQALVLVLLVHVLDVVLHEEDVGLAVAVDLDGGAVVPLDGAADLLAVLQLDDH